MSNNCCFRSDVETQEEKELESKGSIKVVNIDRSSQKVEKKERGIMKHVRTPCGEQGKKDQDSDRSASIISEAQIYNPFIDY